MKTIKKVITFMLTAALLATATLVFASAAGASVSVSSSSLTVGDTLTVSVNMSMGSGKIAAAEGTLSFDSSVLEYTSGTNTNLISGGKVKMVNYGDNEKSSLSFSIKFKAKAAGTSSLKLSGSVADYDNESSVYNVSASKLVTVKSKAALSNDATLKSLSGSYGSLSPSFSPNVTSYSVTVPSSVTTYTMSAKANHSGAKVTVSGSKTLSIGKNTRTVTVTAEDGITKKSYTVTVTREKGNESSHTSSDTVSKASSNTSSAVSSVPVGTTFTIDGVNYTVKTDWPAETSLPVGFTAIEYQIGGHNIAALKSEGGTVLVYASDGNGNEKFVIYNSDGSFEEFRTIVYNGKCYILTEKDRTVAVPAGFKTAQADILGKAERVWTDSNGRTLIYAISDSGEKGFYLYDQSSGTVEPFVSETLSDDSSQATSSEGWLDSYRNNSDALFKTVIAETLAIVVLTAALVVFIILYARKRRDFSE